MLNLTIKIIQNFMPELPEVETIVLELRSKILGQRIEKVEIYDRKILKVKPEDFEKAILGSKIESIQRRGKLIIFQLSSGWSLIIHLKLTGQLIIGSQPGIGEARLIYYFENGLILKHYDFRKFGFVKLIPTNELEKYFLKEKIGPEPLSPQFTLDQFKEILKKKPNSLIKPTLMDQSLIAGVGNIYAQEACFRAQILPFRKNKTLKEDEIKRLYQSLQKILKEAIRYRGSSVDAYLDAFGQKGEFVPRLQVYGRAGEKCFRCGTILKAKKIGGRTTVWCPHCQK